MPSRRPHACATLAHIRRPIAGWLQYWRNNLVQDGVSRLVEQFDSVVHDVWGAHPKPTHASLERISQVLRIRLPDLLVSLAAESSRFANVFLSLGDNYESRDHIIPYNRYWRERRRTRRLPKDLVIITNGWMDEDFDCLVRPETSDGLPVAVEFWSPAPIGYPKHSVRGPRHESFEAFLLEWIRHHSGIGQQPG